MKQSASVDDYIDQFSPPVQVILQQLRSVIQKQVPEAKEKISYGIPTFTFHGNLIHFAGYDNHIGLYPGSAPVKQFAEELKGYETSKGTIRFPLDKPLPYSLISRVVAACVQRNLAKP